MQSRVDAPPLPPAGRAIPLSGRPTRDERRTVNSAGVAARDTLAVAVTGQTYDELAQDPEQKAAFETLVSDIADRAIAPEIRVVDEGDVDASTQVMPLPDGVSEAFVPGKDGQPGTILIVRSALEGGQLDATLSEEMGEHASMLGLQVHEGDAGARLRLAVSGEGFVYRK